MRLRKLFVEYYVLNYTFLPEFDKKIKIINNLKTIKMEKKIPNNKFFNMYQCVWFLIYDKKSIKMKSKCIFLIQNYSTTHIYLIPQLKTKFRTV